MIKIGCVAHSHYPYQEEVAFAKNNDFEILQIWYDKNGISVTCDGDPIENIRMNNFPAIIHALLDINEIEEHIPKLIKILKTLDHQELIIHPICKSETATYETIDKLSDKVKLAAARLLTIGVKLFIENNSKLDSILIIAKEIDYLFTQNPDVGFLLDLAHIDSYETLRDIVRAKFPDFLHIADKRFANIHEHLPIGQGELDFSLIFSKYLKGYNGKAILEITQSKEDLVNSKQALERAF